MPELRPFACRGDHVNAVPEAACRQRGHRRLELLVVLPQREPAVDDEEHVAETVAGGAAGRGQAPVGRDRADAAFGEGALAPLEEGAQFRHGPPYLVAARARGDAADVRQPLQGRQRTAAEVEDVELDFGGRVQQGEGADQGAQQGGLPAARRADDRGVPRRLGQVGPQRIPPLLVRPVDESEHRVQRPLSLAARGGQPARRDGERRQQFGERRRLRQRRRPDLVRGRPMAGELGDHDIEQRIGPGRSRGRGPGRSRGSGRPGRHRHVRRPELGDHGLGNRRHLPFGIIDLDRRTGDVGSLEPGHPRGVHLQEPVAGLGGQLVGVRHAQDNPRFLRAERPQADPVRQLCLQAPQPAFFQPLCGEQQVHAERPADPADRHEQVDELRLGGQQLGELVEHDEQRGHRRQARPASRGPGGGVVAQRGVVAGLAEQLLAPDQLPGQGVPHPVHQRELVGEVGDHGRDVRQPVEAEERRAALEVHEHEVQLLG